MLALGQTPSSGAVSSMSGLRESGHLGWRADRQAHREHRALARLARHRHVAAHHARKLARDGKAKPRSAELLRGRGIGLGEFFEQLCLLLRRHANASIRDGELEEAAAIAHLACRKLDLARFGELAGIAEEVEQYLPQPHGVDGERAKVVRGLNRETVLVLVSKLSCRTDDLVDQRRELHGLRIELELACFNLR